MNLTRWLTALTLSLAPLAAQAQFTPGKAPPAAAPGTAPAIRGGSINGADIGQSVPKSGQFTTLHATGALTGRSAAFSSPLASGVSSLRVGANLANAHGRNIVPNFASVIGQSTGTLSSNPSVVYNLFQVQRDALAVGGGYGAEAVLLAIYDNFGGPAMTGARAALRVSLIMNQATHNTAVNPYHRALAINASAADPDGGKPARHNSELFGQITDASLLPGAMYWNALVGTEIDASVAAGASADYKIGLQIVKKSLDASRGAAEDVALAFVDQIGSAVGWKSGILFGARHGTWPFDKDSLMIGTEATALGGRPYTAATGIDFSGVRFGKAFLKSIGFEVDPAGGTRTTSLRVTAPRVPASSRDACAKGQISYNHAFVYVCVATNTWRRAALTDW